MVQNNPRFFGHARGRDGVVRSATMAERGRDYGSNLEVDTVSTFATARGMNELEGGDGIRQLLPPARSRDERLET